MNYVIPTPAKTSTTAGGSPFFRRTKRCCDILLALALLPLVGSIALIILALNPSRNPGPLLYSQLRIGLHGVPFRIYKFRTMTVTNAQAGDTPRPARFATEEMDRVGRMGRFLRRTRIDELPQVFNVLKGEMSFIGPRPEQVSFAEEYMRLIPHYDSRHVVRPGLSGLAQIKLGYTADAGGTRKKLDYDLQYISESSFRMETYILWRTLVTVTTGAGAA